jgi:hypothetical protein
MSKTSHDEGEPTMTEMVCQENPDENLTRNGCRNAPHRRPQTGHYFQIGMRQSEQPMLRSKC